MGYLDLDGLKTFWNGLKAKLDGKSDVGHKHEKADITDFPEIPTVDVDKAYVDTRDSKKFTNHPQGAYNVNTCYDEGVYLVSKGSNCPSGSQYGSLFVMPYRKPTGNTTPDYCVRLFIPNGDDSKPYLQVRTSHQNAWDAWQVLTRGDFNIVTSSTAPASTTDSKTITLVI